MTERQGPVVCYDLDQTLGNFTKIIQGATEGTPEELGARPHLIPLLTEVQNRGGSNIVTTTGRLEYANRVLELTKLHPYFEMVFDGDAINLGHGKDYSRVSERLGLSTQDELEKLIATGDLRYDQPAQKGNVFVWHPQGNSYSASLLHDVIFNLFDTGDNNFQQGFTVLYDRAERGNATYDNVKREVGLVQLASGVTLELERHNPHMPTHRPRLHKDIIVPTVRILEAEKYRINPLNPLS